ncbi:MAG: hypothetical protein ACETWT_01440 [Thermodesulfobacteriota bacterium]
MKEGVASLKVGIDKYTPVTENLWYEIPNPPYPPSIPDAFTIGTSQNKYVTQGFKVNEACSLKMVGIIVWQQWGQSPPGLKVMIYTDDGNGNPNTKLGEATFSGINTTENWRFAEFGTAISLSGATQYHRVYCRTDEGTGDYYECRDRYGDPSYDYVQYGTSLSTLTAKTDCDLIFRCFKDEATQNYHFKITSLGAKNISGLLGIEYWIKSNKTTANWLQASMGESALGEQTNNPTIATSWSGIAWDISEIAPASRDAIVYFGFKVLDADQSGVSDWGPRNGKIWLWIDYIRAAGLKEIKVKFSDEILRLFPPRVHEGFRDGCWPDYYLADSLKIKPESIEIDGLRAILSFELTIDWTNLDTGSEKIASGTMFILLNPQKMGQLLPPKSRLHAPVVLRESEAVTIPATQIGDVLAVFIMTPVGI